MTHLDFHPGTVRDRYGLVVCAICRQDGHAASACDEVTRCGCCGARYHEPEPECPECGSVEVECSGCGEHGSKLDACELEGEHYCPTCSAGLVRFAQWTLGRIAQTIPAPAPGEVA